MLSLAAGRGKKTLPRLFALKCDEHQRSSVCVQVGSTDQIAPRSLLARDRDPGIELYGADITAEALEDAEPLTVSARLSDLVDAFAHEAWQEGPTIAPLSPENLAPGRAGSPIRSPRTEQSAKKNDSSDVKVAIVGTTAPSLWGDVPTETWKD